MDSVKECSLDSLRQIFETERVQHRGIYVGLEGPDGCGKTTIARRIREITGVTVFHRHPPLFGYNPVMSIGMEYAALKLYHDVGFHLLEERTFIGYDVYRNNPAFTSQIRQELLRLVTERNSYLYVFLTAPNHILRQRLKQKGEMVANLDIDIAKYEEFFHEIRPTVADYQDLNMIEIDANRPVEDICMDILVALNGVVK